LAFFQRTQNLKRRKMLARPKGFEPLTSAFGEQPYQTKSIT